MNNVIFKKQLIILISIFILIVGISTVSANENTYDSNQSINTYDSNIANTNLEVNDNNIIQSQNNDIKSNVTIDVKDIEMYYKNGTKLTGKLLDNNSNPIVNQTINININGVNYNRTTDNNGVFGMNINLDPNVYNFTVMYNGSNIYNPAFNNGKVTVLSTIVSNDLNKYYKNESQFYATFLDKQGKPIANNTAVQFNINGVLYTRHTNENGTAKLNINLNPGTFIITSFHPDGLQVGNNISVNKTLITYDISQPCNISGSATFNAEVLDGQGNPLSNASVTFSVSGKVLTKLTNSEGIASINISAYPGIYIITTSYNGYSIGNTLEIYNNNTGFKRYNLGSNENGTVHLYKSIGNTSSNIRIAYIIGVHVTENAVHKALFDELTKKSDELNYCYDIYKINVIPINESGQSTNRMKGQLLGHDFVVPEAIKNNYSFVVDVHSNEGGAYVITNFAFAPAQDNESKAIATKIINDNPGLSEYFPESQTSPAYVTLPIQKSGTPTIIYETYKFEDYNKVTVPYVDLLIESVDHYFNNKQNGEIINEEK